MAENRLLDTNVLVYAYDVSETRRRATAKGLVDDVWDAGGGVLTLQNLSEFFFAEHYPFSSSHRERRDFAVKRELASILEQKLDPAKNLHP